MFPNKIEKILFYPITILATIFALNAILSQQFVQAVGLTLLAVFFWTSPFIKNHKILKLVRPIFWIAVAAVAIFSFYTILWLVSEETQKLWRLRG